MCCLLTVLFFIGPRAGILIWWLLNSVRWEVAFPGSFIWPLLGFLFLPWTTLMYVLVLPSLIPGLDWIWIGLAVLVDIGSYVGGGYGNRKKVSKST